MPFWKDFVYTKNEVEDDDLPLAKYRLYDDDGKLRSSPSATSPSSPPSLAFPLHPPVSRPSRPSHLTVTYADPSEGPTHAASRQNHIRPDTPAVNAVHLSTHNKNMNAKAAISVFENPRKRERSPPTSATETPSYTRRSHSPMVQKPSLEVHGHDVGEGETTSARSSAPERASRSSPSIHVDSEGSNLGGVGTEWKRKRSESRSSSNSNSNTHAPSKSPAVHPPKSPALGGGSSTAAAVLPAHRIREPAVSRAPTYSPVPDHDTHRNSASPSLGNSLTLSTTANSSRSSRGRASPVARQPSASSTRIPKTHRGKTGGQTGLPSASSSFRSCSPSRPLSTSTHSSGSSELESIGEETQKFSQLYTADEKRGNSKKPNAPLRSPSSTKGKEAISPQDQKKKKTTKRAGKEEVENLNELSMSQLRVYATERSISTKGARSKGALVKVIQKAKK